MTKLKVKIKGSILQNFVKGALTESWVGSEAMPSKPNNAPIEFEPSIIQPKTETQVADSDLPVDDKEWNPGNLVQLGMAMKQMAERVPDSQIPYIWPRLCLLVQKAIENVQDPSIPQSPANTEI